jgi:hypothetical protein
MEPVIIGTITYWLIASSLYALFLQSIYRLYNPDYVILTVVGGVVLTWAGIHYLAVSLPMESWREYETWTIIGFSITAVPQGIWQTWQYFWRRRNHRRRANGGAS